MESYNTETSQTKPMLSLTGFITLLGLVAKMGVTGSNIYFPFVTGISFRTGVAALSSAGTWFTISVGHSCCSH